MQLIEARQMLVDEMRKHGLLDAGWVWNFDNAKRRFGVCRYGKKRISLSAPLCKLNSREQVLDTILHEIAHALAGSDAGHGYRWKMKCREIGANPTRCYSTEDVATPAAKWVGTCPSCGQTIERHRLTDKAQRVACARCCGGRYDARFKYVWRENIRQYA